jgi:mannitol-specific phosphotransferase system IIBC component
MKKLMKFVFMAIFFFNLLYGCSPGCVTPSISDTAKESIISQFNTIDVKIDTSISSLLIQLKTAHLSQEQSKIEVQKKESLMKLDVINILATKHNITNFQKLLIIDQNIKSLDD